MLRSATGCLRDDGENWDGDTLALLPRTLFVEHGYRYEELSVYPGRLGSCTGACGRTAGSVS